nr:DUF2877 domain-containing protein [Streptomyces coryli]
MPTVPTAPSASAAPSAPAAAVATALPALARLRLSRKLPPSVEPLADALVAVLAAPAGTPAAPNAAIHQAAVPLLGLGPGLTPSGDDYLCGLLLAAHAAAPSPPRWLAPLAEAVSSLAPERTTLVSASLLHQAAESGHCIPEVADLLHATAAPAAGGSVPPIALAALLAVGHSSGSDLLHGLRAGARLLCKAPAVTP